MKIQLESATVAAAIAPLSGAFAPSAPLTARSSSSLASYLDTLSGQQPNGAYAPPPYQVSSAPPPPPAASSGKSTGFCHVPLEYFAFDNLSSKGPRASYDWGTPQDWSRQLADDGVFSAGSWYCSEGGWPSPNGKAVTEVFYVLDGHGMLGDSDGAKHFFGPGDTVIIPPDARHWHGSAPGQLFSHLAMSETSDTGAGTQWQEAVSDADYNAAPAKDGV